MLTVLTNLLTPTQRWQTDELQSAVRSLKNLLSGNATPASALNDMAEFQPKRKAQWLQASRFAASGKALSQCLQHIGWPDSLIFTIRLGDDTGNYPAIFNDIVHEHAIDRELRTVYGKLKTPAILFILGIFIAVFTLGFNVYNLNKQAPAGKLKESFINKLAVLCHQPFEYPVISVIIIVLIALAGLFAFSRPAIREQLHEKLLRLPSLGTGLRYLLFALWSRRVAMLAQAGLPLPDAMIRAALALPPLLKRAVETVVKHNTRGLAEAAVPTSAGDPRHIIPIYIRNAIRLSDKYADVASHFTEAAESLLDEGRAGATRALERLETVAMICTYAAAGAPIAISIINMQSILKAM